MTQKESLGKIYVDRAIELTKPGAIYPLIKPNLDRARAALERHELETIEDKDKEKAFNKIAAVYLSGLYGGAGDSPDLAGGEIKRWLGQGPEAAAALNRIYGALKSKNKTTLEYELLQAYLSNATSIKLETLNTEVTHQPDPVKEDYASGLASILAEVDGYTGSRVTVLQNPSGALQGLAQRLATAENFGKPKPAGKG